MTRAAIETAAAALLVIGAVAPSSPFAASPAREGGTAGPFADAPAAGAKPTPIAPGQTLQGEIPYSRPFEGGAAFEMAAGVAGPITIETSTLEFDTFLKASVVNRDGSLTFLKAEPDGGEGFCSRLLLDVEQGKRYRIEVLPEEEPFCGRRFEISVRTGWPTPLYDDPARDPNYWDRVLEMAKERGTPECRVWAEWGRSGGWVWWVFRPAPAKEVLDLTEEHFDSDHPALIMMRERAGMTGAAGWTTEERKARRLPLLKAALEGAERHYGPEDLRLVSILGTMAAQERSAARLERMHSILKAHPEAIDGRTLGWACWNVSMYRQTVHASPDPFIEVCRQDLARLESVYGGDHPYVADQSLYLGGMLMGTPRALESVAMGERMIRIIERAHGASGMNFPYYHFAGVFYSNTGTPGMTEVNRRAAEIWKGHYGREHSLLIANLMECLIDEGDLAGARSLADRVVALIEADQPNRAWDVRHDRASYRLSLARWHLAAGEAQEAARRLDEVDRILAEVERPLSQEGASPPYWVPDVRGQVGDLRVRLLEQTGEYARAREIREKSLSRLLEESGPDSVEVARAEADLGSLLVAMGEWQAARETLEHAVAVLERYYGPRSLLLTKPLLALGRAQAPGAPGAAPSQEQLARAMETALKAEEISREHLRVISGGSSERAALAVAKWRAKGSDLALSLLRQGGGEARRIFDAQIRSRALVLDEVASRNRVVFATSDPEVRRLAEEVALARTRVANLSLGGGEKEQSPAEKRRMLGIVVAAQEKAERALAERSAPFVEQERRAAAGIDEVAEAVPEGAALVAYVHYTDLLAAPGGETPSYGAFVLTAGGSEPAFVPLGDASPIDALARRWREEAGVPPAPWAAAESRSEAGAALREAIWEPVAERLGGAQHLFVVPDGTLNLVNFAALTDRSGRFLLETGPLVHYLSAERDLATAPRPLARPSGALLALGGPTFDATQMFAALGAEAKGKRAGGEGTKMAEIPSGAPGTEQKSASSFAHAEGVGASESTAAARAGAGGSSVGGGSGDASSPALAAVTFRGERSGCTEFGSMKFPPLPGTDREIKEVASIWRKAAEGKDADLVRLTGAAATEAAFKAQAPGTRTLHLATHGFFLGGSCQSALTDTRGFGKVVTSEISRIEPTKGESPLILSGLALAGANHRSAAGPDEEDGILTAQEIAAIDLSSVEWAVLSACETGVGEVQAGEGVLGLRRAFEVAGAGTLIMSLWSVEDEATREWMKALYEARLTKGMTTAEAVRDASLSVIKERRERKQSTHPFYWAAFVAAGDWR